MAIGAFDNSSKSCKQKFIYFTVKNKIAFSIECIDEQKRPMVVSMKIYTYPKKPEKVPEDEDDEDDDDDENEGDYDDDEGDDY
ncbi:MAG: hypothetical protein ACP5FR_03460 [Candidatus Micrarchaeia archaeon]